MTAASHAAAGVLLSVGIAVLASYVGLELALRVAAAAHPRARRVWLFAGSVALGTGIWSMHFVGLAAARFPFGVGYEPVVTVLSWCAAIGVAAFLLARANPARPRNPTVTAVCAGIGGVAMHGLGMAAMHVEPGLAYDPLWTVAAALAAAVGTGAAVRLVPRLARRAPGRVGTHLAAALLLGGGLAAMHYLAMAGTTWADGAVCISGAGVDARKTGTLIAIGSLLMLVMTLAMTTLQRWTESLARTADRSLAEAREQLQSAAFADGLTGLPNRLLFVDRLRQACARARQGGRRVSVALVDLDGFRAVNEAHGEAAADRVLCDVAARLAAAVREGDTVARVDSDHFLVLCEGVLTPLDALERARQLREAVREPFALAAGTLHLTASVGVSLYPDDGEAERLIDHAVSACADVKQAGGDGFRCFEAATDRAARRDQDLVHDLRRALERGELALHYQPKVRARNGQIVGVEALLRWRHARLGPVGPDVFIPLAERYGLIDAIGRWVIGEACRQMAAWRDQGLRMRVAINLSARQLDQPGLAEDIGIVLAHHAIEPGTLTCEITESAAMQDPDAALGFFAQLKAAGVALSIDDFGTGHSSLAYLRRFPVDQLKVDRSFVRDLEHDATARALVGAVIQLAHALGQEVVAEGVETEGQEAALRELGVDKLQGWRYGKAMPPEELLRLATAECAEPVAFANSLFSPV